MTKRPRLLAHSLSCFLLILPGGDGTQTLQVIDGDGRSTTIATAQISALPHVTVNVRDHDKDAQFEGVPSHR